MSKILKALALGVVALPLLAGPVAAQEFVPAVVFDMGGKFDKSFNEAAYNGAEQLEDFHRTEPLDPEAVDVVPKWDAYTMGYAPDGRHRGAHWQRAAHRRDRGPG